MRSCFHRAQTPPSLPDQQRWYHGHPRGQNRRFVRRLLPYRLSIFPSSKALLVSTLQHEGKLTFTIDGWELQFGTNHLGHFLLAHLFTDTLVASGEEQNDSTRVLKLTYWNDKKPQQESSLLLLWPTSDLEWCGATSIGKETTTRFSSYSRLNWTACITN